MTAIPIHTDQNDPAFNMPYAPAYRVTGGSILFLAGITAAPVYHSHPHIASEFDDIPLDAAEQAEATVANLRVVLDAAGATLTDIVEATRYIKDIDVNQDAINRVFGAAMGSHRPASTTVEVSRLATDPRLVLEVRAVAFVPDKTPNPSLATELKVAIEEQDAATRELTAEVDADVIGRVNDLRTTLDDAGLVPPSDVAGQSLIRGGIEEQLRAAGVSDPQAAAVELMHAGWVPAHTTIVHQLAGDHTPLTIRALAASQRVRRLLNAMTSAP